MSRDAAISLDLPGARGRLPPGEQVERIRARIDRSEIRAALGVPAANRAVPPCARRVIGDKRRRPIVVAVIDAESGYRHARPEIGLDPTQQRAGVAVGRICPESSLQRSFGVRLTTLPREDLRQPCERLGIVGIRFQDAAPRLLAAIELASPPNHARQSLCRGRVSGPCELSVHFFRLIELTIPRERASVVHCRFAIGGVIRYPRLIGCERITQPARPRQRLGAAHRRVARALIGGDERIVRSDRSLVMTAPGQGAREGDSAFRIARLFGDVAFVKRVRFVELVIPRAQRSQTKDCD